MRLLALSAALTAAAALPCAAAVPAAPAPPAIHWRDPLHDSGDAAAKIARKLRLEAGISVKPTCFLSAEGASANRELYLLLATQRVEGGYDAVNIYDRGILSWGLMQWASHANGLQEVLYYAKQRLLAKNKGQVWADLFKAQGLDVQLSGPHRVPAFCVGSGAVWKPMTGEENLRVLFRGTRTVGKYDVVTIERWAKVFARAGRNPTMQAIQNEWATRRLRVCLDEIVDGPWRVRDFSQGDLFSDALTFAFWTNNPAANREHFRRAVRQARLVTGEADPARWPASLFPFLWEQVGLSSTFGAWRHRTASVAQVVPVGKVGRKSAYQQLASRGWRVNALLSSPRVGRTAPGRLWRRGEPKKTVTAPASKAAVPTVPVNKAGLPSKSPALGMQAVEQ